MYSGLDGIFEDGPWAVSRMDPIHIKNNNNIIMIFLLALQGTKKQNEVKLQTKIVGRNGGSYKNTKCETVVGYFDFDINTIIVFEPLCIFSRFVGLKELRVRPITLTYEYLSGWFSSAS